MKKVIVLGILASLLTACAAYAGITDPCALDIECNTASVPEIDALAGLAAIAVIGATIALVRERLRA